MASVKLVAFAAVVSHLPDIGGKLRSNSSREIYEEGLQIPLMRLLDGGKPNDVLIEIITQNIRVSEQGMGDIWAQVSGCRTMGERLQGLLETVDIDALIARVRQANPAQPAIRVDLPGSPTSPYLIVTKRHADDGPRASTTTFVDRYSGSVLDVWRPGVSETCGDTIVAWLGPLHTGHFGGPVVNAVWALLGLAPAALAMTGAVMWWNRLIVPWRRRAARRAANA